MPADCPETTKMNVLIVGGGTAGWMTAAALARFLKSHISIQLIESEEIGIVGVGEATLPHLRAFIERLGLDEAEFMRTTKATFKLGIEFCDFGKIGDSYVHPFGDFGMPLAGVPFHQYWLRGQQELGLDDAIEDYSMPIAMSRAKRFVRPKADGDLLANSFGYAYQFDATRMAPMLRRHAEAQGVERIEGRINAVERRADGGIGKVKTEDGREFEADLFIDCSGFRSLLIGEMAENNWEDWSHWLPCDRAAALPCTSPEGEIEPYTRATAMSAGWRWRIPLQHRVGNGYVFSSAHISEDQACADILAAIEGEPLADPRILRFRAGRRKRSWVGNVVSIGLASGFLEPLESTSIHLAQMAIMRLVELFPERDISDSDRDEFNRLVDYEYDRVRDFLILHYHATQRDDSEFWNHVRTMEIPDSLATKMELWRSSGRIEHYGEGLFLAPSWIAVYLGQGIMPERHDPRADIVPASRLGSAMRDLRDAVADNVGGMSGHRDAIAALGAWGDA